MLYYGKNTVISVLSSNQMINELFITKNFSDKKILDLIYKRKLIPIIVSEEKLNSMSNSGNHQGIIISAFDYNYSTLDKIIDCGKNNENSLVIILDGVEDPQNFGSIIRTAEAVDVDGIIIPKNRSVKVTPTVAKVSTGAINSIKIAQETNINQSIKKLKDAGYWIVSAHMETEIFYDQVDYKMKIALIVGSEGKGVSSNVLKKSDFIVKIPMYGKVSSLNVAVSSAIIMYQINSNRQNN